MNQNFFECFHNHIAQPWSPGDFPWVGNDYSFCYVGGLFLSHRRNINRKHQLAHAWHETRAQTATSTSLTMVTARPSPHLSSSFRTFQRSVCVTPVWETPTNEKHWPQRMPLSMITSDLLVFSEELKRVS